MLAAQRSFGGDAASVGEARRFLRRTLAEWGAEAFDGSATLVLSELAANSVLHAHSGFTVDLRLDGDFLRLSISDGAVRSPRRRAHSAEATTGRGLAIVNALAHAWGVEKRPGGKTVWAEIRGGPERGTGEELDGSSSLQLFPALEEPESGGRFGDNELRALAPAA